jgi:rubrerythrin
MTYKPNFFAWLMRQRKRDDEVGALARYLDEDERRHRVMFQSPYYKTKANLRDDWHDARTIVYAVLHALDFTLEELP